MLQLSRFFTVLFILTSFISRSLGESGILFRITPPDIFGAIAIFFFIFSGRGYNFGKYAYAIGFIFILFMGGLFGLNFFQSLVEVLILFFLLMVFMTIVSHFDSQEGLKKLIVYIAWAGILASFFGIYDSAASMIGLPRFFPGRSQGEVLGAFRNGGQAGAYALILLAVLIPVRSSRIIDLFRPKQKQIINYSVILTIIFLFLTGKIAAYIGFVVGMSLYFLLQRNFKSFIMSFVVMVIFYFMFTNLESIAPDIAKRINNKYNTRVAVNFDDDGSSVLDEDQFIGSNLRLAIEAFEDNPVTGSGIGAFGGGFYSKYEIHSTYFKMIGEGGIIGVLAYLVFVYYFMQKLKFRSRKTPYQEYLYYLYPFIIGCFVSWAYTYHMRKREFWIMFAVIIIVDQLIKNDIVSLNENIIRNKKNIQDAT